MPRPLWAEVDLEALVHNLKTIKKRLSPGTEIMAVVKANAYGHGAPAVAAAAIKGGARWLGVASLEEGLELRQRSITAPILILGYTPPSDAEELVRGNFSQTVFCWEQLEDLNRVGARRGTPLAIHLKIDTGMGRLGFLPCQMEELWTVLKDLPYLRLEGVFTHLAWADGPHLSYTHKQIEAFQQALGLMRRANLSPLWIHAANSAGLLRLPQSHFNLVRTGILLYGYYPSPDLASLDLDLKPVLTLKTQIISLKELPAGSCVSYGCTFKTSSPTRVAVLPVGYADGYAWNLSNKAQVLIRGQRVPVVGRVCMDHCMVDVTALPEIQLGEEVVLVGGQGKEFISAEEVACWRGTMVYEVLTSISSRVARVYKGEI